MHPEAVFRRHPSPEEGRWVSLQVDDAAHAHGKEKA